MRAAMRFAAALRSRGNPVTYAILAFNVIVYLVMAVAAGGNIMTNLISGVDAPTLLAFGAKTNDLLQRGQWFRLVTPIFIHIGLLHIASNSYALWIIGPQVERLYGSARFLLIYLLSGMAGIAGSYIGSMLRQRPNVPSAGASGALFGLFGVLFVFGYKYRHELPPALRRAFGSGVIPVIAINLFIGATVPFIDNSAHIGGLIAGGALAVLVPYVAPGKERFSPAGLVLIAFCVLLIGYSFTQAYRYGHGQMIGARSTIQTFLEAINGADRAMADGIRAAQEPAGSGQRKTAIAELGVAAEKLDKARGPDDRADSLRAQFSRLARKQEDLLSNADTSASDLDANARDFEILGKQLAEWVDTDGPIFGLKRSTDDK
jgi:membrane associated rhomboid family serine protease